MNSILHTTIAMLAVINPFVCGIMILEIQKGNNIRKNIITSIKTMAIVLAILVVSSLSGHYILSVFGISMDAFKIVGGIIIAFIGFQMLSGKIGNESKDGKQGLTKLIMFAASPGSIAMVITLSVVHHGYKLPYSDLIGTTVAVTVALVVMILMQLFLKNKKPSGSSMFSRFMGLIIVAMGLQFILEGIKLFFIS